MQMSPPDISSNNTPSTESQKYYTASSTLFCSKCQQPLDGEFVRALDGTFHWECFCCLDCNEPVASKFFPIETFDGTQRPLCERDYFRRLNLVCETCGDALRGSYITAVNKKFHLEHFCCSICSVVFGPEDSYYEHDNNVYCHYHYSINFAIKCSGCQIAILKQFVEINRNSVDEHWHPECYMIHKFWNVKLAQPFGDNDKTHDHFDLSQMTVDQLRDRQNAMEEKVYRIWTVLSAFEESAAACISDMLVHVSEGSYVEGVKMADYFIIHVEVLFDAIDDLLNQYHAVAQDELCHQREAKMLCKKVSNFFALLSHTQESGLRRIGVTQELLSLVTGLAHYLKVLIRIALTGALRLEKQYDMKMTAISRFLSQLMELANKQRCFPAAPEPLMTFDFCQVCKQVCDDQCFKFQHYLWHDRCFACCKCCAPLRDQYREVSLDPSDQTLLCKHCATQTPGLRQGFEHVTQLQQYSFLLRVSLKRLYNLLNVNENAALYDRTDDRHAIQHNIHPPSEILTKDPYAASYPNGDKLAEKINLGDIKRMKSTHMKRKLTDSYRVAKRSTLMETPSPNAAYLTSQPDDQGIASGQQNDSCENFIANTEETTLANLHILGNEDALTLDDIPQLVAAQQQIQSSQGPTQHQQTQNYTKIKPDSKFYYFAELGALDHFMVKHIAVLYLEEIVKSYFTIEELADLIDDKKNSTLWGKFVAGLKAGGNKKAPRAKGKSTVTNTKRYNQSHTAALQNLEGTFGVPLDILVEKNGVESNLGAGPTRIRIPSFVDDSISAMKQMDMSIEGIFRKNGNIKRLKVTSEEIDKNPSGYQLINERPIQIAALTKKFLRELPDPLLTFKLHKLFIVAQKLETEAERKRVTHLACCLLPKPNRDTMEVLFLFMKWVATFAHIDEESGSKMDLLNLATVLAPNILYSKSKDPAKDESFAAIESVHMLLKYQEEFCTVPEDFVPMLKNLSYGEGDMERNVRDILKKCEVAMKLKKSHSAGNYPTMPPRQHSSPAAVPTSSSILQSPQQEYPAHYHLSTSPVDITYPPNSPNTSPYFLSSPSEQFPTQHSAPTHSGAASMLVSDALR